MGVAFLSASSGGGNTNAAVAKPGGVAAGVLLIAVASCSYDSPITPDQSWNTIHSDAATGSVSVRMAVYWRIATAAEPAVYNFGSPGGTTINAIVAAYTGAQASSPVQASGATPAVSGTITAPSVLATGPGIALTAMTFRGGVSNALPTPSGTTLRAEQHAQVPAILLADAVVLAAGSTPERTASETFAWPNVGTTVIVRQANTAPNAPTPLSPVGGVAKDRTQPIVLAAQFSDPDTGDSPSASLWYYRMTGTATWTEADQPNTAQTYTIPANALAAGDYEWQAEYADQAGVWGPRSASEFFTAADPTSPPVWLDPLDGQTITTDAYTGRISIADLDASEWTLYADNNGAPGAVLQGPVLVETGDLRTHRFTGLVNNVPVWWGARARKDGLWSQIRFVGTPVSYTRPTVPTVALAPAGTALTVTVTNPAPGAGVPAVTSNEIWIDDGDGFERRAVITANGTWTYPTPRSQHDYAGNVRAVAIGDNGTTTSS